MVDAAVKEVVEGISDPQPLLPTYLTKWKEGLLCSLSALKQVHNEMLRQRWRKLWVDLLRYKRYDNIFGDSYSFSDFKTMVREASRNQLSLLIQLQMGHTPLNKHLHRIQRVESEYCHRCKGEPETVKHYLLNC
ncbi:hypothetical protein J132_10746 [Termitomyces sp. J132]|nr:hypothetical protein J132_10746 [Termitomyces sp. J132]